MLASAILLHKLLWRAIWFLWKMSDNRLMDPEITKRLDEQGQKIDAIYRSVEKTRKYFFWTMIISIAFIVLPLIGLAFAIPSFLSQLNTITNIQ